MSTAADEAAKPRRVRDPARTRASILNAAERVFESKGYAGAAMREIAAQAGVTLSLVNKHFVSKERLFEEALRTATLPPETFQQDRGAFGLNIVRSVDDPAVRMAAPRMIALSCGDEEASRAISHTTRRDILEPMADWLGGTSAEARARAILMLTMGYALFSGRVAADTQTSHDGETAALVASLLQALVDGEARLLIAAGRPAGVDEPERAP